MTPYLYMTTHNTATIKYIETYLVGKIKLFLRISVKYIYIYIYTYICVCVCVCVCVCRFQNENMRNSKRESLAINYKFNLKNKKVILVLLKWIFRKWDMGVWTGSSWLRIGTGDGHLWMR